MENNFKVWSLFHTHIDPLHFEQRAYGLFLVLYRRLVKVAIKHEKYNATKQQTIIIHIICEN